MANGGSIVANLRLKVDEFKQGMADARKEVTNFSGATKRVASGAGKAFKVAGTAAGVAFSALGVGAVRAAANGEQQLAKMETAMQGNTKAAKEYLAWAREFGKTTPFTADEVVDASIKLKSYGIDAKETLGTIGDMAAGMGKPLDQAIEAVADAQTGELERLKEFGITKQMLIDEALKLGKGEIVNAKGQITNMDAMNEALLSIMQKRFEGGMERQSKTFNGQLSTLKDNWTTFLRAIGDGILPVLRDALIKINEWAAQIDFEAVATTARNAFQGLVTAIVTVGRAISGIVNFVQENATAFKVLAMVLTAVLAPALLGVMTHMAVMKTKAMVALIASTIKMIATNYALAVSYLAAYAPLLLIIGGIGLLVAGFLLFTKNGDAVIAELQDMGLNLSGLRGFIEGVRAKLMELWNAFAGSEIFGVVTTIISAVTGKFVDLWHAIQTLITSSDFTPLITAVQQFIPTILAVLIGGVPGMILAGLSLIGGIADGMGLSIPQLIQKIIGIITSIINQIVIMLPAIINAGMQILISLINGIIVALPQIIQTIMLVINSLISTITTLLPLIIQAGITILTSLISGILMILPQLIGAAISLITTIITVIITNLPKIINAGIQILMALIRGIIQILPQLISAAITLITTILTVLIQNLPKILNAGIKILMALIDGIIQILPQLIDAAFRLIIAIVNTLIQNLPKIISAGMKLLLALIRGIIRILPQLISAAFRLIGALVGALIRNLPELLRAGVKLIGALIKGVLSLIGSVGKAAMDIGSAIFDTISSIDLWGVGKDLIRGLWNGIKSVGGWIKGKISDFASGITDKVKSVFGIHSPSRVFRDEIAGNLMAGLSIGIDRMKKAPAKSMNGVIEGIQKGADTIKRISEGVGDIRVSTPQFGDVGGKIDIQSAVPYDSDNRDKENGTNYNAPLVNVDQMNVRSDEDVRQVSRELYNLQRAHDRARGGR